MEMCNDEPQIAEKKSRAVLLSSGKSNAIPINGEPKTSEVTSRYLSSSTPTQRSSSPNVHRQINGMHRPQSTERRPTTPPTPITRDITSRYKLNIPSSPRLPSVNTSNGTQRSQSVERKIPTRPPSPSIRRSTPLSPPSTPSLRSPRLSSSLTSSQFSRHTTVHDTITDSLTSKVSQSRRATNGLWPSIHSLSDSLVSDTSSDSSNKSDRASRNPSPLKIPMRENSHHVENLHVKAIDQHKWPSMIGGKISTRSIDLMDKTARPTSLSTSLRGLSPSRSRKPPSNEVARPSSSNGRELSTHSITSPRATSHSSENARIGTRHNRSPSPSPSLVRPSSPLRSKNSSSNEVARPSSSNGRELSMPSVTSPTVTSHSSQNAMLSTRYNRSPSPIPSLVRPSSPLRSRKSSSNEVARPISSNGRELSMPSVTSPRVTSHSSENAMISTRYNRSPSPIPSLAGTSSPSRSRKPSSNEVTRPSSSNGSELSTHSITSSKATSDSSKNAMISTRCNRSPSPNPSLVRPSSPSRSRKPSSNEVTRPSSSNGKELSIHSTENATISTRPSRIPSPIPSLLCPSSPRKASSSSRLMASPIRTRPSSPSASSTSSGVGVLSSTSNYLTDGRKGNRSPSHIEDAHQLRLLHSRELQWRFVNARAELAISTHNLVAEDKLYNTWSITSDIYDSIIENRINVQNLRQEIASMLIINEQISYLEEWNALEAEHSNSLIGTTNALKATTLHLPVTERARADVRDVKNAISSAVDVMQAMGPNVCYLFPKVEATHSLILELSDLVEIESFMIDECRELLALTSAMQVQESSLEAHLIQLKQQNQLAE